MRILGIDTGTKPAFAIVNQEGVCAPEVEKIISYDFTNMMHLHGSVGRWLGFRMLLDEVGNGVDAVAYEDVHWHTGVDAAHIYGAWWTLIELWAHENKLRVIPIAVATGKRALSGRGDAKHEAMREALHKRFGIVDRTKAADMAHAVGVALAGLTK
jgi:crossover junction endodeoxyribonuclease RuvC